MITNDIVLLLKTKFTEHVIVQVDENASPKAIVIEAANLLDVCKELHANEKTYFDMLSCITGLDNGPEAGTMEVVYNLYSIPYEISLMIRVVISRKDPEVSSVTEVWKTADWLEREIYDMFGIWFTGHPDMRRILMPADWEGYPLRKDYQQQEYYRGIKVEY
ncbi:NADH-ubiquinone oxidoreductase chain C [Fulvivirga imtechensis AK7]|uniref:NADH-quinone oxidoreductase subunit C n=1 Tax=Fulvivirga imtechensis AK7 TaxID=1237149 RepID=L8JN01_9BACT|nr:NADH-quinone oxidoreductase subunit C [Fulvivirga imtechensis]ELR70296.1 NADH-ubiquinone oxidoreductase chain C [Fulvivirga imtechensis AK7]